MRRIQLRTKCVVALFFVSQACGGGGGGGGGGGSGGGQASASQPGTATLTPPVTPPSAPVPPVTTLVPKFSTDYAGFVGTPSGTAVADLDGDGHDDVIVITTDFFRTGAGSDELFVFYQRPDGLTDVKFVATAGAFSNWTWSVAACDVDGDGKREILVGYGVGDLGIYKIAADGTPFLSATLPGVRANKILCADLDGDGFSDVVTSGKIGTNMQLFLQRNGRLVEQGSYPTDAFSIAFGTGTQVYNPLIEIGDINGDGKPDIVFFARAPFPAKVTLNAYLQTVPGQFAAPITLDFPRDSNDDIPASGLAFGHLQAASRNLAVSLGLNAPSAKLAVTSQGTNGQTLSSSSLATSDIPTAIRMRDLNADGRPDIVVFHNGYGAVGIYYQNPDGTFTDEQFLRMFVADQALGPDVIAFGDFNSDGKLDIAVVDQTALFVFVQQ